MKYRFRSVFLLMLCLLLLGCGADRQNTDAAADESPLWQLSKRYTANYSTVYHAYTYEKDGQFFYLTESGNARIPVNRTVTLLDTKEKDGIVCSLYQNDKKGDDTKQSYTFYEYVTDAHRYVLGIEESGLLMESLLSMDEAIELFEHPTSPAHGVVLQNEEWSAFYRLDSCYLDISIYPNDGGRQYRLAESSADAREESGESYLYDTSVDAVIYTNGTSTVRIRQSNRSETEHVSYNTLSECKAILAMLGKK